MDAGRGWLIFGLPPSEVAAHPIETDADDGRHELYLMCDDNNGIALIWPPTNEPWGVRECRVMHPDGHTFRTSAPLIK